MSLLIVTISLCIGHSEALERSQIDRARSAYPEASIIVREVSCGVP